MKGRTAFWDLLTYPHRGARRGVAEARPPDPSVRGFVGNTLRDNKYETPPVGHDWRTGWGHP